MTLLGFDARDVRMTVNLFKYTLRDRFLGSALGLVWAVFGPALMLGIFTFVFGFVFRSKLPGSEKSLTFVIWLITGYGPWLAISDGLSTAASSVVGNAGIIKNLSFKSELLPVVGVLMGLVPLAVAVMFVVALLVTTGAVPSLPWLVVPLVIVLQFVFVAGLGLFLGALTVFVRDVAMALPNLLLLIMFASPIFYPIAAFPKFVQPVVQLNPFYLITEGYRTPLMQHQLPPWWALLYLLGAATLTSTVGLYFFRRLKPHFDAFL